MPTPTRIWFWAEPDPDAASPCARLLSVGESWRCGRAPRLGDIPADAEMVVVMPPAASALQRVRERCPSAVVVVAMARPTAGDVVRLLEAGARGVLDLTADDEELSHGLRAMLSHGAVVPPALQAVVAAALLKRRGLALQRDARIARLSAVEIEMLALLAAGSDRAAIARQRGEPISLVRTRVVRATAKLGVHSQRQALALLAECQRPDD